MQLLISLALVSVFIIAGQTKPVDEKIGRGAGEPPARGRGKAGQDRWLPPGHMDKEPFHETHGMGKEKLERTRERMRELKSILAHRAGRQPPKATDTDEFMDDLLFTEEQIDYLIQSNNGRQKRKVINTNSSTSAFKAWDIAQPIPFMFDGGHDTDSQAKIRTAIAHWEERTCIRFQEYTDSAPVGRQYLLFTNLNNGCWSFIGQIADPIPQTINLWTADCLRGSKLGTPIHEVGHALGLFHEHTRHDRDNYVTVLIDNVIKGYEANFEAQTPDVLRTLSVPYDTTSVMHYSSRAFTTDPSLKTISAKNPLYDLNMGQRDGLSFLDAKIANLAYCPASCPGANPCQRAGYPNPNNCATCVCPDGFGGDLCEAVALSDSVCNAPSDGVIEVTSGTETCFEFGPYSSGDECNWHLKAPTGCLIQARFDSYLSLLCGTLNSSPVCLHYVELKFDNGLQVPGPRFCCTDGPGLGGSDPLTSERNEMMMTVRSPYPGYTRRGFRFCYKLADATCKVATRTTTTTTQPTTTTTQPTTTQPTTTSTKPTTTTTQPTTTTTQPTTTTTKPTTTTTQPTTTTTQPTTTTTKSTTTQPTTTTTQPTTTTTKPTTTTTQPTTTTTKPTTTSTKPTTTKPTTTTNQPTTTTRSTTTTAKPATSTTSSPRTTAKPTTTSRPASSTIQSTTSTSGPRTSPSEGRPCTRGLFRACSVSWRFRQRNWYRCTRCLQDSRPRRG